ncbi:MAG: DUF3244 domain-containing protein [Bacteroidales bacterium]|nr:DUF3244 domain-containing protein [Bacteroidales bacterium]
MVLMYCLILSGALCYAKNMSQIEKGGGIPIEIIVSTSSLSGLDKGNSIFTTIDDHVLSVVFFENLGNVTVEVSSTSGSENQIESTPTPNGVIFYIANSGSYIVTITLSGGDEYYGEFEVTD